MTFQEILHEIVDRTPGARGAALVDAEGIALDEYRGAGQDVDVAALAAEFQGLLAHACKLAPAALGTSAPLGEMLLCAGDQQFLLRRVDDDFFLVVALRRDALLGKARYLADLFLPDLRGAL